jgi:hypothetical protein
LLTTGATLALAGCTEESESDGGGGGQQTTDSDGDGVPDRSDYAPRDPDVQSENDVEQASGGDTASGGGSEPTDSGDSVSDDDGSNSGGSGAGSSDGVPDDFTYPSHSGQHTISARENYWAWEFSVPGRFVLSYTAQNARDENYDFDVLLYDPESFREYRAIATEQEEGIRPQYLDGSAPGVESGVQATVELPAGTYYLVIDNTDLSDAGDWGTEDTRSVYLQAETRAP